MPLFRGSLKRGRQQRLHLLSQVHSTSPHGKAGRLHCSGLTVRLTPDTTVRDARRGSSGPPITVPDIGERALIARRPGPYQLQAAIAALHDEAETPGATDWPQIALLYRELMALAPSPVVELNLSVAVAMSDGPAVGLAMVDGLAADGRLDDYVYLHATRADLLRRLDRRSEAALAYRRALTLATNATERRFLERRLAEVEAAGERRPD